MHSLMGVLPVNIFHFLDVKGTQYFRCQLCLHLQVDIKEKEIMYYVGIRRKVSP